MIEPVYATGLEAGLQGRPQRAPEVVGHDHGIKLLGQRPGLVFNIDLHHRAIRAGGLQGRGIAVNAQHGMTLLLKELHVSAMAAGQVQHLAARGQQVMPAFDPGRWGGGVMHVHL